MTSERNNKEILLEARFILPETNPEGFLRDDVHEDLEAVLVENFGGFNTTATETFKMDEVENELAHDDALSYEVVIPNTSLHLNKLKKIAIEFAGKLDQNFVYFRQPNGEVYFLDV